MPVETVDNSEFIEWRWCNHVKIQPWTGQQRHVELVDNSDMRIHVVFEEKKIKLVCHNCYMFASMSPRLS